MKKKHKNRKMVDEIMSFVKSNGGIEYATLVMSDYKNKALEILSHFPDNEANDSLVRLVEYTTERKK